MPEEEEEEEEEEPSYCFNVPWVVCICWCYFIIQGMQLLPFF